MKQRSCCSRTGSFDSFFYDCPLIFVGRGGILVAFGPEGRGFEFRCSRHARDLGQVLHLQLPVALRRINSDTVLIAVVGSASE